MPSIYEGNLSKTMVKQVNRNTLAKKRADKLKKDKEKYPLPTVIKQGMNNTIKQSNASARAENNRRTMVTNLIMDKYKMPYDEARAAYENVLIPYEKEQEKTAERAAFIGDKYNMNTLFTSKRESPGYQSARALDNMLTPTEGKVTENPYFKQGVGMEGFLSTTNAGRAVSDPNAENRYRIAGDAAAGRADVPYNANTFNQQFKDIKASFEEDPKLMAEIVGMSLAQDYVKTALPIMAGPFGGAVMGTDTGKALNKGIMQFALDKAPVSDEAKYAVKEDWLAPATATSFIDPALTGLGIATGGVTGAFPVTSKLVKAGKAVATSEKAATAGRMTKGAVVGARQGLSQPQGLGMNFADIFEGAVGGASEARQRTQEVKNVQNAFEEALTAGDEDLATALAQTLREMQTPNKSVKPKSLTQRIDDAITFSQQSDTNRAAVEVTDEELRILTLRNPKALEEARSGRAEGVNTSRVYIAPREEAPLVQQLRNQKGRPDYKLLKDEMIRRGIITPKQAREMESLQGEEYKEAYQSIFGLEDTDRATNYYIYTVNAKGKKIPLDEEPDHIEAQAKLARYAHKLLLDPTVDNGVVEELFRLINSPENFAGLHKRTNQSMGAKGADTYSAEGRDVYGLFDEDTHYTQRKNNLDVILKSILKNKYSEYKDFDYQNYDWNPKTSLEIMQGVWSSGARR